MIVIIDGSGLLYACRYILQQGDTHYFAEPTIYNTLSFEGLVLQFLTNEKFGLFPLLHQWDNPLSRVYVLLDWKGSISTFRTQLYPAYKGQRHTTETEEEKKIHRAVFLFLYSRLEHLGFIPISLKGVEADDIAYYLVHKHQNESGLLISGDGDWQLNLRPGWQLYRPRKGDTYTWEDFCHDMQSEDPLTVFHYYKSIMGDTSDNVKGVPGLGPKRTLPLVHDLLQIRENKYIQKIHDHWDIVERNLVLFHPKWILSAKKICQQIESHIPHKRDIKFCEDAERVYREFCQRFTQISPSAIPIFLRYLNMYRHLQAKYLPV